MEKAPRITQALLQEHCRHIGIDPGDTIMVHASLRSVGAMLGGPDILIRALLERLGPNGTMMAYLGCQSPYDDVGRGCYSPEDEAFILEHCPPFDKNAARANRDFGAFAELFRTTQGVLCSANPCARMAAIGAKAATLTDNHPLNYGLGIGSPLDRLCKIAGKVLLIGSDPDQVTLLHYAEALAPIENKRIVRIKFPIRTEAGNWIDIEEYDSSIGVRVWTELFFAEIVERYVKEGRAITGRLGNATTQLLDAQGLVDFAIPIMVSRAEELDAMASAR